MMNDQQNPYQPGAGARPPYLAGRMKEKEAFQKLLQQKKVLKNLIITGLRGIGKTVLLEDLKPMAIKSGWLWAGTELSESASVSEDTIATRILTDLSIATRGLLSMKRKAAGFSGEIEESILDFRTINNFYDQQPGLVADKLKNTLEYIWNALCTVEGVKGIVFAYDEAQEMNDQKGKEQYPLSLLLEVFSSLQRRDFPFILVLAGLPTLYPKVGETRGYAERMFDVQRLEKLSLDEAKEAISIPLKNFGPNMGFSDDSIDLIAKTSGGYPFFIQFICRETYDSFLAQKAQGSTDISVPLDEIIAKLDNEFFEPKWERATERERDLLASIALLDNCQEFSIKEIVEAQKKHRVPNPMGDSQINQTLTKLSKKDLVFRTPRHGKYTLGIPMLQDYIKRQRNL